MKKGTKVRFNTLDEYKYGLDVWDNVGELMIDKHFNLDEIYTITGIDESDPNCHIIVGDDGDAWSIPSEFLDVVVDTSSHNVTVRTLGSSISFEMPDGFTVRDALDEYYKRTSKSLESHDLYDDNGNRIYNTNMESPSYIAAVLSTNRAVVPDIIESKPIVLLNPKSKLLCQL